jgi:hypothetical protein
MTKIHDLRKTFSFTAECYSEKISTRGTLPRGAGMNKRQLIRLALVIGFLWVSSVQGQAPATPWPEWKTQKIADVARSIDALMNDLK